MSAPQAIPWLLTQERVEMLAKELFTMADILDRAVSGCARGERVKRLLNDLRAHTVAAGGQDPFPCFALDLVFPDTPKPTWPNPTLLRSADVGQGAEARHV